MKVIVMADSRLTNGEREAWRQAYMLHEQYHECAWTADDWIRFDEQISRMYDESGGDQLLMELLIGLLEYFYKQSKVKAVTV